MRKRSKISFVLFILSSIFAFAKLTNHSFMETIIPSLNHLTSFIERLYRSFQNSRPILKKAVSNSHQI